jgi:hypothetical protein
VLTPVGDALYYHPLPVPMSGAIGTGVEAALTGAATGSAALKILLTSCQ